MDFFRSIVGKHRIRSGCHDARRNIFHPFPRLPFEVRQQIWTEALPSWRLLSVFPRENTGDLLKLHCHAHLRPLLHTCSESRAVVLHEYYKPQPADATIEALTGDSELFINYERDILFFPTCTSLPKKEDIQALTQFQRIALSENGAAFLSQMHLRGHHFLANTLSAFKKLEELWIIGDEHSSDVRPVEKGTPYEDIREAFIAGLESFLMSHPGHHAFRDLKFFYIGRTQRFSLTVDAFEPPQPEG